jgi:hypothetical protein
MALAMLPPPMKAIGGSAAAEEGDVGRDDMEGLLGKSGRKRDSIVASTPILLDSPGKIG